MPKVTPMLAWPVGPMLLLVARDRGIVLEQRPLTVPPFSGVPSALRDCTTSVDELPGAPLMPLGETRVRLAALMMAKRAVALESVENELGRRSTPCRAAGTGSRCWYCR